MKKREKRTSASDKIKAEIANSPKPHKVIYFFKQDFFFLSVFFFFVVVVKRRLFVLKNRSIRLKQLNFTQKAKSKKM